MAINENQAAMSVTENNAATANVAPETVNDNVRTIKPGLGPQEFADGLESLLKSCDLGKFDAKIFKAHKAKDENGAVIDGQEDGHYIAIDVRMPGTTEMTLGDGKLYSKNVRFTVSAFKVQESPYTVASTKAAPATALTMDAVRAKLHSTAPAAPKEKAKK